MYAPFKIQLSTAIDYLTSSICEVKQQTTTTTTKEAVMNGLKCVITDGPQSDKSSNYLPNSFFWKLHFESLVSLTFKNWVIKDKKWIESISIALRSCWTIERILIKKTAMGFSALYLGVETKRTVVVQVCGI